MKRPPASVSTAAMLVPMAIAIVLLAVGTVLYGETFLPGEEGVRGGLHVYLPAIAMGYGAIVILALAVVELRFYRLRAFDLERREARLREAVGELEMEEETRGESLAGMLHDDVGGGLTALRMELELAQRSPDPAAWERCYAAIDRLLAQVRGLSRTVYPKMVGSLGLTGMLRGISETLGGSGRQAIRFAFEGPVDDLPPRIALCVLRIVQEAIVNAARHSNGDRVDVRVSVRGGEATGLVEDDGTGRTECREGLGLTLLRERVRHFGGSLDVRVTKVGGVAVSFRLPVREEEAA